MNIPLTSNSLNYAKVHNCQWIILLYVNKENLTSKEGIAIYKKRCMHTLPLTSCTFGALYTIQNSKYKLDISYLWKYELFVNHKLLAKDDYINASLLTSSYITSFHRLKSLDHNEKAMEIEYNTHIK